MKSWFSALSAELPSSSHASYVISHTFSGVGDCFDIDEIWERPRVGLRDRKRLRGLLEECMYKDSEQQSRVFAYVVVELPANMVERDRRTSRGGNSNRKNLATRLADMHRKSFGKFVGSDFEARFVVEPALDLADDQVRVRFGHGIYLPGPDEARAWRIESSCDGLWPRASEEVTLAEKQHLVLLGSSDEHASIACPNWPFSANVVLINEPDQENLEISAEPLGALKVHFDEKLKCHVVEGAGKIEPGQTVARYYLKLTRLQPVQIAKASSIAAPQALPEIPAEAPPSVLRSGKRQGRIEPRLATDDKGAELSFGGLKMADIAKLEMPPTDAENEAIPEGGTMLPQIVQAPVEEEGTWVYEVSPLHRSHLELAGLAIQRPSRFQGYGIRALAFGIDNTGKVVPPEAPESVVKITVDQNDAVEAASRNGCRELEIGDYLPLSNGETLGLEALPYEFAEHYRGWLPISSGPKLALHAGKELMAGRDAKKTMTGVLQVLSGKGFLSARQDPGADCMGISSEHCRLQLLESGELSVKALGQLPVAVLDSDLRFVEQISNGESKLLSDGQYLVIGHYVWQFRGGAK